MRKIRFRAKRKDNGEWVEGDYFRENHLGEIRHCITRYERLKGSDITYEVIPETVGQFTGLTESYERTESVEPKYVYQHDILEIEYKGKTIICFVEFEICGFILVSNDFADGYIWITDVEEHDADDYWISFSRIIGNIHDNPELLTNKE